MKLVSLSGRNFMPYRERFELLFPQDEQRNVMIVFGDNMRGKTSLMNALRWAFYGEALGRHSRPIPLHEIINKDSALVDDWSVEVHVKFEANGHAYDLRRVADRKPLIATPTKPEDFSREIHLTRDGIVVHGDSVDAEIGLIAPKQISRFFLFDGELLQEYETLLIENNQQGEQIKDAIEQVLGVPALTNGRTDIQTILRQAQKKQNQDLKQIAGLEKQAERHADLTTRHDAVVRDLEDYNERLKRVRDERVVLEDEIEAAQSVLAASTKLEAKVNERKFLTEECDKKEGERLDLLSGAWKDLIEGVLQVRRMQLENKRKGLLDGIKKQSGLQLQVNNLKALLDTKTCPTCLQNIGDDRRAEMGTALGLAEIELQAISDNTEALQRTSVELDELSKVRGTNAKDRLRQVDTDLLSHQVRLTQIENDIEKLRDEIAGQDTAELQRKRIRLAEKIKEEGRQQDEIIKQKAELERLNDELAISQKAIEGLTKDRIQRSTIKVSLCTDLEKVFLQSIEQLRDKLRSRVETLANDAFKKMTTQKSYKGLEINKNYGLQIIDGNRRTVPVRSAGAEQVVALSLIDGLNRTGRAAGPVIMDTPFGRLDLNHRDNILSYLPSVTSQFVLLVHSGEIRPETDLKVIAGRIGATYEIKEISSTQSRLERTTLS